MTGRSVVLVVARMLATCNFFYKTCSAPQIIRGIAHIRPDHLICRFMFNCCRGVLIIIQDLKASKKVRVAPPFCGKLQQQSFLIKRIFTTNFTLYILNPLIPNWILDPRFDILNTSLNNLNHFTQCNIMVAFPKRI